MQDDPPVPSLVTRAQAGDQQAWDALVDRYAPLVWSICRRYRLADADADVVGRTVWLRLADQLDKISDLAALPPWLATATAQESGRAVQAVRRSPSAGPTPQATSRPGPTAPIAEHELEHELQRAARHTALHEAFTHLPPDCQRLLTLLTDDPPPPDAEISAELGIPIGRIGHDRSRCLETLRRHLTIAALINVGQATSEPQDAGIAAPY